MGWPVIKRGSSAFALAIAPGVGTAGTGAWLWLAHAPIAGAIVGCLGTMAAAVVTIVKIRTDRTPEQLYAETQAALAKKVDDKREAMLLITFHALATKPTAKQADAAASEKSFSTLIELFRRMTSSHPSGPAELQPPDAVPDTCPPGTSADPSGQVTDEQIKRIFDEQQDSNTGALMFC
jgi:hypothetical protein